MKLGRTLWASWCGVVLLSEEEVFAGFSLDSDAPPTAKDDASADQYSNMAWLTEQCQGERTSQQRLEIEACLQWSTGLEHESFLVHRHDENKEEYVVNVGSVANQMSRYGRAFGLDREAHSVAVYLEKTGVEFSGRSCAGINEINFKSMAEAVSTDHKQLSFDSAFCQVELLKEKMIEVVSASPGEGSLVGSLGAVQPPRAGMSSQLGIYTRTGGKTYLCSSCDRCDLKDYTGSYHVSISLPHDPDGWVVYDEAVLGEDGRTCSETYAREADEDGAETPLSVWVEAHQNLANMVQWIEPLFLAVFGASDSEAVCDQGEFVEGSFRTMSSGWGIPGTTDVRTFGDVGTGRFSHTGFDWLLEMITPSSSGILGCESEGMGADIRTISSSSPRDLPTCQCPVEDGDDDESRLSRPSDLPSMNVGEGIEIRVFDNFPAENMKTVYRVVALVAEASRVHHAGEYIYDSLSWRNAAQAAMREGWNAILGAEYVADVERNLNVDLSLLQGNTQAFQVFRELSDQLFNTHKNGLWTGLFLDDVESGMAIGSPNRASWEDGAMNMGVTPAKIREMLNLDEYDVFTVAEDSGRVACGDDAEDLLYLAQTYGMVESLEMNTDGSAKAAGFFPASQDEDVVLRSCMAA